uniref:Calpain catalytic domain-containing protein n=1 Tax=Alexandrium monilatum TaxID=311494 RepID=A0A7S4R5T6_9DINO
MKDVEGVGSGARRDLRALALGLEELLADVRVIALVGVALLAWCLGWLRCEPLGELAATSARVVLTLARVALYCVPGCRRRVPEEAWSGELWHGLRPQVLPDASLAGVRARAATEHLASAADGWADPVEREERIDLGGPRSPGRVLLELLTGRRGVRVEWRRACTVLDGEHTLFGDDGPRPADVEQGEVGDCYLLSAMAALAEEPALIRRLFLQDALSEDGRYCLFLAKHGRWTPVVVDDVVPTQGGRPLMARSNGTGKLWPLLLEKAWVAEFGWGRYMEVDSGFPQFPLHVLTNCPVVRYDVRTHAPDAIWEALASGEGSCAAAAFCSQKPLVPPVRPPGFGRRAQRFREALVVCHCSELLFAAVALACQVAKALLCCPVAACRPLEWLLERCVGEAGCSGICEGHAYSLLEVLEVPGGCCEGGRERLVKLRNPWGDTEWRGRYSDGSSAWTEEAAELAGLEQGDDGVFFMPWDDFLAYFSGVAICYLRPGEHSTPLARTFPRQPGSPKLQRPGPKTCPASGSWHCRSYACQVDAEAVRSGGPGARPPSCACRLVVPVGCEAFVTSDDPTDGGHGGFYDAIGSRRCILLFDLQTRELVGRNQPVFQDLDSAWNPAEDTGVFDELTSLSTTRMNLAAGQYLLAVSWHPQSTAATIPRRLVFIVTASVPGLELVPLHPGDVRCGSSACSSEGSSCGSPGGSDMSSEASSDHG